MGHLYHGHTPEFVGMVQVTYGHTPEIVPTFQLDDTHTQEACTPSALPNGATPVARRRH